MRTAYGIVCALVATLFVAVQVWRFGFGTPVGVQAVFMLLALTVIFLVASVFLHHPTYDDVGPTAAIALSTGIADGLLTFYFILRGRTEPTVPGYVALGVYALGFTAAGVLLFLWRKNGGFPARARKYMGLQGGPDQAGLGFGRPDGGQPGSRTVEEVVALRRKTQVHHSSTDEHAGGIG